ncbi:MAG: FAD-dependent oxidoreductase [Vampirovibrionales bacterium]
MTVSPSMYEVSHRHTLPFESNHRHYALVILGDELESMMLALSYAMQCQEAHASQPSASSQEGLQPSRILLIRPLQEPGLPLGGLSTRGGLSYMDLTLECLPPMMGWLLQQTPWKRVALYPEALHTLCERLLRAYEVEIQCVSPEQLLTWRLLEPKASDTTAQKTSQGLSCLCHDGKTLTATYWVDTTPDGLWLEAQGVPCVTGLGNLWGEGIEKNALGLSPMPTFHGLTTHQLITWEHAMREHHQDTLPALLDAAFPFHPASYKKAYLTRPCFAPEEADYIDLLNPSIGVLWHQWQQTQGILPHTLSYREAPWWVDGGNIARLGASPYGGEKLAWNGIVLKAQSLQEGYELSSGRIRQIPQRFYDAVQHFQTFITATYTMLFGECPTLHATLAPQPYVRNSVLYPAEVTVTGEHLFNGGVSTEEAIGWFSYWLDFRGIDLWEHLALQEAPQKPAFRVGLKQTRPLGFPEWCQAHVRAVSRAVGASPLGQSVCRIVQHQCLLAEALGIELALRHPLPSSTSPSHVSETALARSVRYVLKQRQAQWQCPSKLVCEATLHHLTPSHGVDSLPQAFMPYYLKDRAIMGIV